MRSSVRSRLAPPLTSVHGVARRHYDLFVLDPSDLRANGSAPPSLSALSRFALHESGLNALAKAASAALARNKSSEQSEGKADWLSPLMRRPGEADTAVSASN